MAELGLRAELCVLSSGPRSTRFSQQPRRHNLLTSTTAYVQVPQGTGADLLYSGLNDHQHFFLTKLFCRILYPVNWICSESTLKQAELLQDI